MNLIIERVKISAAAKQQLTTLKKRTGIEHYNVICRHALCASLANESKIPDENMQFSGGIEIDWKVFAGESHDTLLNILIYRALFDDGDSSIDNIRKTLTVHLHRGLSYLASRSEAVL
jgi:DNA sulfur modification protein DndE